MRTDCIRTLAILALAACASLANAAEVIINGWAYGQGSKVTVATAAGSYGRAAGGLTGSLSGTAGHDAAPFITYSLELEDRVTFGSTAVSGYQLVDGADYFQQRLGDAGIADQLGRLMSYAYDQPGLTASADGSTALQMAIWDTVYGLDPSRIRVLDSRSGYDYLATSDLLLTGAGSLASSRYDVFALQRAGSADLLVLQTRSLGVEVPEPGTLLLVGAALAVLFQARRSSVSASAPSRTNSARL